MLVFVLITIVIIIIISVIAVGAMRKHEGFMIHYNDIAPIFPEKGKSVWDYYGNYNNYLMDGLTSGKEIDYLDGKAPYCDAPNRNRSYLVNPLLTQKHIFIKPNIDEFNDDVVPDFGNSAEAIRIGAFEELMVPQVNDWYGNFSETVKKIKDPRIRQKYKEQYMQRCGTFRNDIPRSTLTNPY